MLAEKKSESDEEEETSDETEEKASSLAKKEDTEQQAISKSQEGTDTADLRKAAAGSLAEILNGALEDSEQQVGSQEQLQLHDDDDLYDRIDQWNERYLSKNQ